MITASHLYQYIACPRWPRNEFHGDPTQKRGRSKFLQKLLEDGDAHEKAIYKELAPAFVSYPDGDFAAGAVATRRLLADGEARVAQAVLASGRRHGIVDLLERRPGKSALGDFTYEPVEIKTARSVKAVYRFQLAFYADLMSEILGRWPEEAHVILADGHRESFALESLRPDYERLLRELERVIDTGDAPVHISSTCGECPWEAPCLVEAEKTRDVTLTYGLQRKAAFALRQKGVHTLAHLAASEPRVVARWTGVTVQIAQQLVTQAQVLETGEARWKGALDYERPDAEIFFDIEGDPEHDVMYLFGVLTRTKDGREDYRAFVAEEPAHEGRAFGELLAYLEEQKGAPIYHYHHYERAAIQSLAARHQVAPSRTPGVLSRMRDLHRDLSATVVLPVYSYSLKAVAKRLGFHWTHPEASAAQSMVWYASWLKSGERAMLDHAVEYNADDCRATRRLKDWLAEGPGAPFENDEPAALSRRARSPV